MRIANVSFILLSLLTAFSAAKSRAENVLVIGDSHTCGPFGASLVTKLSEKDSVDAYCTESSNAKNWLEGFNPSGKHCETFSSHHLTPVRCSGTPNGKTPALATLLQGKHYDRVIVALGTNSMGSPHADHDYGALAQVIAQANANDPAQKKINCDWVGPPHVRPDQASGSFTYQGLSLMESNIGKFYDSLKTKSSAIEKKQNKYTVADACEVIDSMASTAKNLPGGQTRDGVHRNESPGSSWASSVFDQELRIRTYESFKGSFFRRAGSGQMDCPPN